jgi:hypothetical protein
MGYTLRLRWEWLARMEPDRLWVTVPGKEDMTICAMFHAPVTVVVGNDLRVLF